ncbi:MAG: FG-GAP repeat domain-containing protein [Chloroflexota bacterium]
MNLKTVDPSVRMRRRMTPLVLGVVLAASLLGVDLGVAAPVRAQAAAPLSAAIPSAAGPCVAGWREMPVPDAAFISTPFEAVTRKGKPAWILGGSNRGLLALKWTGSRWKRTATGSRGHRGIGGGVAISATKVLGVGYSRPIQQEGGSLDPISGRLVGTAWKGRRVPDPPGPRATLTDVTSLAGGKAWAVGTRLQGGKLRAYALRWNGKKWVRKEPFSGGGAGLMAVDRTPSGAVWAAGWREISRGRPRPLFAKRTNKGWKTSRGASLPAGSAVVTDIAFRSGKEGWAVGYLIPSGSSRHRVFLQRWNGTRWKLVALPWADDFSAIPRSIAAGADGELWIGGVQLANGAREGRGFVAHLKDGSWNISVLGVPKDIRSEVLDVGVTAWGAIAAANVGASLLVLRTCVASAASVASDSDRISISNMQARREAEDADPYHLGDPGADEEIAAGAVGIAGGGAVSLAAPKAPKGFIVKDKTAAAGLAANTRTYDGFVGDFDGNGWKDIFYSRHGAVLPRLAMGSASGFNYAPAGAFSTIDRHGCGRADVNRDGKVDVLCAVGGARGKALGRHELSLSAFTPQRRLARGSLGIADPASRGRKVAFLRLDKDAYPEVFIVSSPDRDDGLPAYNRFFRNVGGRFVSAPGVGLDTTQGGACLLTGDFDKDGDQDLVYCTQFPLNGRTAGIRFMRNEGGKLRDRTGRRNIKPMNDIDVAFADFDGDGRKDLVQLSSKRLRVSRWTPAGYRKIYEAKISGGLALAVGDASGDGRADIYVVRDSNKKNLPDRLLIGRKGGRKFTSVKIPQTSKGNGDDVMALDYDKNGLMDFFVLNGRKQAGPVQLLASFRR